MFSWRYTVRIYSRLAVRYVFCFIPMSVSYKLVYDPEIKINKSSVPFTTIHLPFPSPPP